MQGSEASSQRSVKNQEAEIIHLLIDFDSTWCGLRAEESKEELCFLPETCSCPKCLEAYEQVYEGTT